MSLVQGIDNLAKHKQRLVDGTRFLHSHPHVICTSVVLAARKINQVQFTDEPFRRVRFECLLDLQQAREWGWYMRRSCRLALAPSQERASGQWGSGRTCGHAACELVSGLNRVAQMLVGWCAGVLVCWCAGGMAGRCI